MIPGKDFHVRGILTEERYDEIKQEVVFMFEECQIDTYPIDCFEIARKLYYVLRPYSSLGPAMYLEAISTSTDSYSKVETDPQTGMNRYVIYFNDSIANTGRLRWNIFHEIGHIYLGHHDHPDDSRYKIEEAEADFFAKYAIAPPPLVNEARCENPDDIVAIFESSHDAARYVFEYYKKWLQFGPRDYLPFEKNLLRLFHLTAA